MHIPTLQKKIDIWMKRYNRAKSNGCSTFITDFYLQKAEKYAGMIASKTGWFKVERKQAKHDHRLGLDRPMWVP